MEQLLDIRSEAAEALSARRPVVALESTLIAQGLPYPRNLETARRAEAIVREAGAVPATVGIVGGSLAVGLSDEEIERFARTQTIAKVSRRDLAAVIAGGGEGATTVAGTMIAARLAGIRVMGTGGIGGVHRGGESSLDISADLTELARTPVAVVCAGPKAILDLPRTLEVLETHGVPVIGYGTDELPAFYHGSSGLAVDSRVDTAEAAARVCLAQWGLGLDGGLLIVQPPPAAAALDPGEVEGWIGNAIAQATSQGVEGKQLTPFLLGRISTMSGGRSLEANVALIEANARTAAEVALAMGGLDAGQASR